MGIIPAPLGIDAITGLGNKLDKTGDATGVTIIPTGGVSRSLPTVVAGLAPIEMFAQGDDLAVDCGPAIIRASAALGVGGKARFSKRYRLASPVPNLTGLAFEGDCGKATVPTATEAVYARTSLIVVAPSAFAPDGGGNVPLGTTRSLTLSPTLAFPGASFRMKHRSGLGSILGTLQFLNVNLGTPVSILTGGTQEFVFDQTDGWVQVT